MQISIIIPVFNEASQLPDLLAHLIPFARQGCEVILVDGGSTDGSFNIAGCSGFVTIQSELGRAKQMNAGAAQANGDVLLFLHADTSLPSGAANLIERVMADGQHQWGRFDIGISGNSAMLKIVGKMINFRSRLTGIATGDQAMFIRRSSFDALKGFPDQALMEDVEMSKRLRQRCKPICLRNKVITSGRRWEKKGIWRTIFLMWRLRWQYWLGASPERLAKLYR